MRRARFVGVSRGGKPIVDKLPTYGKEFTDQERIARELTGLPVDVCSTCGDGFADPDTLRRHCRNIHSKERT